MAGIIEISYFNSYWIKRIATGDLCQEITSSNGVDYITTNTNPTFTYPGPFGGGDFEPQDSEPTNQSEGCNDYNENAPGGGTVANPSFNKQNYYIEESRIRGGFNNVQTDLGVKAYLNEKNPTQKHRVNALIYSGAFNSNNNFNETNVFSVADSITKALDPHNGSIQKLHADDTNLIVCQEDKISRALIDKDAIYSAEGGGSLTSSNLVIGQIVPYAGEFGISKNPESFAVYGFRRYFTDANRNAVLRLSKDGLTEISNYGMIDWFRDRFSSYSSDFKQPKVFNIGLANNPFYTDPNGVVFDNIFAVSNSSSTALPDVGSLVLLSTNSSTWSEVGTVIGVYNDPNNPSKALIETNYNFTNIQGGDNVQITSYTTPRFVGGWDIYTKQYQLSIQDGDNYYADPAINQERTYYTLGFDESVLGWTSFFSFNPSWSGSLKNKYYSTNKGKLYEHYVDSGNNREVFYGVRTPSNVTFVFNPQPDLSKNFLTINYEGTNGWQCPMIFSDAQEATAVSGGATGTTSLYNFQEYESWVDLSIPIRSYIEGAYDSSNPVQYGSSVTTLPIYRSGFDRKENLYTASIRSMSNIRPGEIQPDSLQNENTAGIKANYATVVFTTDDTTDVGGMKELFAVSTSFSKSGF